MDNRIKIRQNNITGIFLAAVIHHYLQQNPEPSNEDIRQLLERHGITWYDWVNNTRGGGYDRT